MKQPEKLIIDIVGLAGSGKSKLSVALSERFGLEMYRPSDALRTYAAKHNIALQNRQDYINIHHALIADDPLAIIEPVISSSAPRIIMDGMRAPLPFLKLREQYGAVLIYLDCPDEIRLQRIQRDISRDAHRQALTLEALQTDEAPDMLNPDRNLPNMIEMKQLADHIIDASKPADEVLAQAKAIISGLLS